MEQKVGGIHPFLHDCLSWVIDLVFALGAPGSQAFGLRLNDFAGFPESPPCRQQIVGLLSLHIISVAFTQGHRNAEEDVTPPRRMWKSKGDGT